MHTTQDPRLSPATLASIRALFAQYRDEITASDRTLHTKATYVSHAERFVRWLEGKITL